MNKRMLINVKDMVKKLKLQNELNLFNSDRVFLLGYLAAMFQSDLIMLKYYSQLSSYLIKLDME